MREQQLNEKIRSSADRHIVLEHCIGQRYIADGLAGKEIKISGIPGNNLGAYLNGARIEVYGNAQDALGDTMNEGEIFIHGSCGDAAGYAMRGGKIFIKGNAGYRAGIHMKAYREKLPVIVIGGKVGSFLGEYQAGGDIIVLGIGYEDSCPVGNFCAAGMHGGRIFLRTRHLPADLPDQVLARRATAADLAGVNTHLAAFCTAFGLDQQALLGETFYVLTPDTKNPYKQLYTHN